MITVTGAKGLAGNRQVTPESFAVSIAAGFKKAYPDTFEANPIGATRFGDRDGFVAVAGAGASRAARTSAARDRADRRRPGQRRCLHDPMGGARAGRGQTCGR
jgi:hypothetical protein